jgi:hypothetical protein
MSVLLANEDEMSTPGLDLFIDIEAPCPMFFASREPPKEALHLAQRVRGGSPKHRS